MSMKIIAFLYLKNSKEPVATVVGALIKVSHELVARISEYLKEIQQQQHGAETLYLPRPTCRTSMPSESSRQSHDPWNVYQESKVA